MAGKQTPRRAGGQPSAGSSSGTTVQGAADGRAACRWLLAAARTGDHAAVAAVIRLHPPARCPAARRERAA